MNAGLVWIRGDWPGHLAVVKRPRGGDWLEDEVDGWRRVDSTLFTVPASTFDCASSAVFVATSTACVRAVSTSSAPAAR